MIFRSALRRLTLIYTAVQLVLFGSLAIGVYVYVTTTFDFDTASRDGTSALDAAEQGFVNLRMALIFGYVALCVLVPFASYWMARAALEPLRASYEQQQHFVDDASHELRSPLSVLRGELELALSRPRSADEYRSSIAVSLDAAQALVALTEELLLLARDSTVQLRTRFEVVSSAVIVEDAIRALESGEQTERIVVHLGDAAFVEGVPALLARAVANVLDNALKYSPGGTDVVVTLATSGGRAVITVADAGVGMSPDELRHVMDRFWRAPNASVVPGHGLGLPLVDRIVRAHRGRLTITSGPGGGSTVSLVLPLVKARELQP